jgi:hypothetical protein
MKQLSYVLMIGFVMLSLALACRQPAGPDPVVPAPITPPASTTTPVSTIVGSTTGVTITAATTYTVPTDPATAYADVPQPPADCRIMKMTYKTVRYGGPILAPEYVTVGNTTFQVSTQYTTTYTYDSQRRLVWERRLRSTGQRDSVHYVYGPGQVLKYNYEYVPNDRYYSDTTVYPVDARGYPVSVPNRQQADADGFLIRTGKDDSNDLSYGWIAYTIKDLNVASMISYVSGGFGTITIPIDRYKTRFELPVLTPFISRPSRNLMAGLIYISSGASFWKDGSKFQENHIYVFDSLGRVKRKIVRSFSLTTDWPYQSDPAGIGVTDYEYTCP